MEVKLLGQHLKDAVIGGHVDQVRSILANGGDVHYCTGNDQKSLLHLAPNCKMLKLLLNCGADINAIDINGMTPLFFAVINKNIDLVISMLTSGAKVNVRGRYRVTALHFASTSQMANVLLSHGSHINARDAYGRTPLTSVLMDRKGFSLFKTLINAGADVQTRVGSYGNTLLHITDSLAVTKELISQGCSVNAINFRRETPLHNAVRHKKEVGIVLELLRHGAVVNAPDWEGKHALLIASTRLISDIDVVKLLLDYGGDVFAKPPENNRNPVINHLQNVALFRLQTAIIWLQYALLRNAGNCRESDVFLGEPILFPKIRLHLAPLINIGVFNAQILPNLIQFRTEIQNMRTFNVFRNFTLYDMLSKKCVCSKPLYRGFRQLEIEILNHFPVYQDIIMPLLKDLLDKGRLFNKLKELQIYCCDSSGNRIVLNVDCVFSIIEYLSEEYIYNLIYAFY